MAGSSYKDEFRDAEVKIGSKVETNDPCPRCNRPAIVEFEITTAGTGRKIKDAGKDYFCTNCNFKWKEKDGYERPGLYIRSAKPDLGYTEQVAGQMMKALDAHCQRLEARYKTPLEKTDRIRELAIREAKEINKELQDLLLTASQNGDIDEKKVDKFWRRSREKIASLERESYSYIGGSDLEALRKICNSYKEIVRNW